MHVAMKALELPSGRSTGMCTGVSHVHDLSKGCMRIHARAAVS